MAPTDIPLDIGHSLVEGLLARKDEELFAASEIFEYPLPAAPVPCFNLVTC